MDEKKRFQKRTLNSEDHQGMEKGAKAIKGIFGTAFAAVTLFANRDNLKTLAHSAADIAKNVIKP